MTKAERIELLRQATRSFVVPWGKRMTLHARGVAVAGNPGAVCNVKVQVRYVPVMPRKASSPFPFAYSGEPHTRRAPKWMHDADAKPRIVIRTKRKARKTALTKIAEQLPQKLKLGSDLKGAPKCSAFRHRENKNPKA